MKFQGISIEQPEPEALVIPHNGVEIIFLAQYVDNYDEFDELVPRPVPVKITMADQSTKVDFEDKGYQKEVQEWSVKRTNWMFIKSLEASKDLTWDLVDIRNPDTYHLFDKELMEAGFNGPTIERIKMTCYKASGLDQTMIDEATTRFLAGRAQESSDKTSPGSEQ